MKKKKFMFTKERFFITFIPSSLIVVLTLFPFLLNIGGIGLMTFSLLLFFPVIFIVQGVYCRIREINLILPIFISLVAFLLMLVIFLNSSALAYMPAYVILGLIGYYLAKILDK